MEVILEKLFVGKVKTLGNKFADNPFERQWESAIYKKAVSGQVYLSKTNLAGDEQADLKHHGGIEKAIFAYPKEHYYYWQTNYPNLQIDVGGMGENFLLNNQLEHEVAIGDTYELGEAIIQVSQPRQPCWKPARRYKKLNFGLEIQQSGRTGWYYRVIKQGNVQANSKLKLLERPYPNYTIAKCNEIMHVTELTNLNLQAAEQLSQCPLLAINWRNTLSIRVNNKKIADNSPRIYGPNIQDN